MELGIVNHGNTMQANFLEDLDSSTEMPLEEAVELILFPYFSQIIYIMMIRSIQELNIDGFSKVVFEPYDLRFKCECLPVIPQKYERVDLSGTANNDRVKDRQIQLSQKSGTTHRFQKFKESPMVYCFLTLTNGFIHVASRWLYYTCTI
ncbi:hypothetical protein YC2023_002252 [Brassica napus]